MRRLEAYLFGAAALLTGRRQRVSRSLMPRVWIKCTALGPRLPVLMRQTSFQGLPRLLFGRATAGQSLVPVGQVTGHGSASIASARTPIIPHGLQIRRRLAK